MSASPCVFDWDGETEARNQANVGEMSEQGSQESFVEDENVYRAFRSGTFLAPPAHMSVWLPSSP